MRAFERRACGNEFLAIDIFAFGQMGERDRGGRKRKQQNKIICLVILEIY